MLEQVQADLTVLYNCHWQFKKLIEERNELINSEEGYNDRCYEIDDQLIPDIVNQVPKNLMHQFNQLINSNV